MIPLNLLDPVDSLSLSLNDSHSLLQLGAFVAQKRRCTRIQEAREHEHEEQSLWHGDECKTPVIWHDIRRRFSWRGSAKHERRSKSIVLLLRILLLLLAWQMSCDVSSFMVSAPPAMQARHTHLKKQPECCVDHSFWSASL
jgi:hypothetical protein